MALTRKGDIKSKVYKSSKFGGGRWQVGVLSSFVDPTPSSGLAYSADPLLSKLRE